MTKQVHIHIHRTKARDAGEGEGKGRWITLSPSGTHVKLDKGGEITAGPKGMSGKKPSELSSKKSAAPKSGTSAPQAGPYYGAPLRGIGFSSPSESPSPRKPENLPAPNPRKILESNKKSMQTLEKLINNPGTLHSVRYDAKQTLANLHKQNEELERQIREQESGMSKPSRPERTPMQQENRKLEAQQLKEARRLERTPANPGMERTTNRLQAKSDLEQAKERIYAKRATARGLTGPNQPSFGKPGPDGKPMGIHPALAAVTPPGFPTPGSGKEPAAVAHEKPQRNTVTGGLNASDVLRKAGTSKGEAQGLYKVAADFLNHADSYQARGDSEKSAQFLKAAGDYYGHAQEAEKKAKRAAARRKSEREQEEFRWRQQQKHAAPAPASEEVVRLGNQAPSSGQVHSLGRPSGKMR